VADHNLVEVHSLCLEQVQSDGSGLMRGVGVDGDRDTGFAVGCRDRLRDSLHAWCQAFLLDHALKEGRLDTGVRDAFTNVPDEQVCQQFRTLEDGAWAAVTEVVR